MIASPLQVCPALLTNLLYIHTSKNLLMGKNRGGVCVCVCVFVCVFVCVCV